MTLVESPHVNVGGDRDYGWECFITEDDMPEDVEGIRLGVGRDAVAQAARQLGSSAGSSLIQYRCRFWSTPQIISYATAIAALSAAAL